jgi:predicted DsbA family dithiol-disulfide isomerase
LPGLALTAAAYAVNDETGENVAMDLRRLVFESGVDVSDPAVLNAVARQHGVAIPENTEAVLSEYAQGRDRQVVGSPHFFVGAKSIFCPTLDIKKVDGVLHVKVDTAAFEELVDICFG